jgi:hypothetical protein
MLKHAKSDDANPVVKSVTSFEIKDADKGEVRAVIATLGVVDRDGDIIRKGAIADGAKVAVSCYGHDAVYGKRPVGKGTLSTEGNKVLFDGRLFLNTMDGRETFEVLKEMGADQEWSFGFRIIGYEVPSEDEQKQGAYRILTKLDAFEVSPVLVGAGIGTRTLAVKQADGDPATPAAVETPIVASEPVVESPKEAPAPPSDAEQETKRAQALGAEIFARFERTRGRLAS